MDKEEMHEMEKLECRRIRKEIERWEGNMETLIWKLNY